MNDFRLRKIQGLAQEIMDEVNKHKLEEKDLELLHLVIDNLSRAVVDVTDPNGNYSIDYLEKKVVKAHSLLMKQG
ncbi:group-specific protein [Sutcliffiella horikoshii]|uniref:Group-specific protein n=1 Tax=Sutcliffiella horikoshii TaxID=79883 RepID=A0A5D4T1D2_9BACI|nr:group-specific protein [Sutcliffiella horikoshii]TYS67916.1 group-specific protein [Sutcliffiella horikoshii]